MEQFLTQQCEAVIGDLRRHGAELIERLRTECRDGADKAQQLLAASLRTRPLIVTLKCTGGPHIGQKFRLEPAAGASEDVFKIGRSTGRHFKERGVSLYKDKEISTTHAKVPGAVHLTAAHYHFDFRSNFVTARPSSSTCAVRTGRF